jgi:hypothetical protein
MGSHFHAHIRHEQIPLYTKGKGHMVILKKVNYKKHNWFYFNFVIFLSFHSMGKMNIMNFNMIG